MKSIRTTTIALVGAALLTIGALTGCSSSDDNKSDASKPAAEDAKGDSSDSKGGGSNQAFCDAYMDFSTLDGTDYQAVVDFWKGVRDAAPSDIKADLDLIVEVNEMALNGNMADFSAKTQDLSDAVTNVGTKVATECTP